MIYIIGGASRSGKTTLSYRLCDRHGIPYFAVDSLRGGLKGGAPQLSDNWNGGEVAEAKIIWPILKLILQSHIRRGRDYVFEGVWMLPRHIAAFARRHPDDVRVCFIGYPNIDLALKHRHVQKFPTHHDWLLAYDEDYIRNHLRLSQRHSRRFQKSCATYGLKFFDIGQGFNTTLDRAERYLLKPAGKKAL